MRRACPRTMLLLLLLLAGACGEQPAAGPEQVRVGIAIPSYVHAVAWIAQDGRFFAREGLTADVRVMGGSAATMRGLIAGNIDVGLAGGDAVVKANRAGADLVILGGLVNRYYHRLVARKEVRSAADLRGRHIGLPFLGGPQEMAAREALALLELPASEVKIVNLGREFDRMAALARGAIQATTSQAPASHLDKLGLHILVDLPASKRPFPYMMLVARRDLLTRRRRLARAVVKALAAAVAYYRDEANRQACLEIIRKRLTGSDTREAELERYRAAGPGLLEPSLRPDLAGLKGVVGRLPAGKPVALERMVDTSLLSK